MYMEEILHKMKLAAGMRLWLCILFRLLKINPKARIKMLAAKALFLVCAENAQKSQMWRRMLKK